MNSTIIILFAIGIMLLLVEVITPGGVLGAIGGLCMLAGAIVAFRVYGPAGGFKAVGLAIAVLALGLFIEFRLLPKTKIGKKMFLSAAVTGQSAPDASLDAARLMGRTGEAVTALGPTGLILVDGHRYEAASRSGFIDQGGQVVVRGGTNFQLIVEKIS
jgi:membrane-bound ClpP family serine protease